MKTRLMSRKLVLAGGLGLLLATLGLTASVAMSALAQPPGFAHQFYGSVKICSTAVLEGEEVSARINGLVVQTTNVDASGNYGYSPNTFKVYGQAGDTIEFYVLDRKAGESPFLATAIPVLTNLDLVVEQVYLTVASTVGGTVTDPGEGLSTHNCTDVVDLLAVQDACYQFVNWTGDVGTVDNVTAPDTTITMNGDYEITANFAKIVYNLTTSVVPEGVGTVTGGGPHDCSSNVAVEATATDPCYEFDHWSGDLSGATNPTSIHIDASKTVTANFAKIEYTLTVEANPTEGGKVTGSGTYDCSTDQPITATAATGYAFVNWTGDADIDDPDSASTTVHIDGDKTATANFETECEVTYDLTVASNAGGSVTVPGEDVFTYCEDEVVELVADAEDCYEFVNWTGDVADSDSPTTTVTMDSDKAVTANFAIIEYDLTVDSTAGGSVTNPGEGVFTYDCGEVVALVAEADPDYQFVNWTGDVADSDSPTTTVTMDSDKAVTANFTLDITYDLTVDSTDSGSVTEPGEGTFEYQAVTVVDLVAEAELGCIFIKWTGEVDSIADVYDATTTITMDDDYEITACFGVLQMDVELDAGWNTFSTPIALQPCADTWGELLALSGIGDDVEVIYYYDGSTQYWGVVSTGFHDEVKPLEGFFVKLKDDSLGGAIPIVAHPASPVPPSKEVYTGANLIGSAPASLEDEDVVSNLTTIYYAEGELLPPGYSLVISPPVNNDDWSVYYRETPEPPTSEEEMQIGRAYWVIMENPDTLWGTSTTPLP